MICLIGNLPVLQVGRHHVTGYDTSWIRNGLARASERAGRDDFPFLDDIYDGVVHYLENKCPLRLLPIEKLNDRIRYMLQRIGYEPVARALTAMAPPITVSLETAAEEAGETFELGFFNRLKEEIKSVREVGAEAIYFSEVKESVKMLKQTEKWNDECDALEEEILDYLVKLGETPRRQGRRIHLPLQRTAQDA